MYPRYSTAGALAKAKALCTFSRSFSLERRLRGGARHHIPGDEDTADQRPGRLEPVRRQVKVAMIAAIARSSTNWMATMVESGTKPGSGNG